MAFDETLDARIRAALARNKGVEEKKMFGGIGFDGARREGRGPSGGHPCRSFILP